MTESVAHDLLWAFAAIVAIQVWGTYLIVHLLVLRRGVFQRRPEVEEPSQILSHSGGRR